ncbi:MAG: hypothetical protein RLZZ324_579 [Candidatus Parcubacteria bacterium]|jgi:hypothetical protein
MHAFLKHPLLRKTALVIGLLAAAAALLSCYSFLPLTAPHIASSPDENAVRVYAERFSSSGLLYLADPIAMFAPDRIVPRAVRMVHDLAVPVGFIGLPVIYGGIAAATGTAALPFMTPVLALLAVAAWGALVARFFGARMGWAAAVLLAVQPVWWYETARTLQPNVAFAAFCVFALYFLFASPFERARDRNLGSRWLKHADAGLAGVFIALALATRSSEVYWFFIITLTALAVSRLRNVPWLRLVIAAVTALFIFAPFVAMNADLYGSPFATGYGTGTDVPVAVATQGHGNALLGAARPLLFPLGFAPRTAFANFWAYGVHMFPWWAWLVLCALVAYVITAAREWRAGILVLCPKRMAFLSAAAALSLWLILFYGSWNVQDNPDPSAVTIGSSYLRYWLPLFVASTVPVAWLITRASYALPRRTGMAMFVSFLALASVAGAYDVFYAPQEGLIAIRRNLFASQAKADAVLAATAEKDAIIVVVRSDKFLWPARHVMVGLRDDGAYATLGYMKNKAPLFYFGITLPEKDLAFMNGVKLPPYGLAMKYVLTSGDESLYRFERTDLPARTPSKR